VVEATTGEATGGATGGTAETTTATKATSKSTAATEATTTRRTAEATTATKATTKAAASTETTTGTTASETILANLKVAALPVETIELSNGVTGIIRRFESNDTGTLGASAGIGVHIGTNDGTLLSCDRGLGSTERAHTRQETSQS
jgi:hypothetical protein